MIINRMVLGVALAVMGLQAFALAQEEESVAAVSNPLVGAWLIVQTSVTDQNGTTVDDSPGPVYISSPSTTSPIC